VTSTIALLVFDHEVLLGILKRKIKDKKFLKLLEDMVKAGYMEDWTYHATYSGTPQGGIVSPLLMNIVLNEVAEFVENILIPKYTQGKQRKANPEYEKYRSKAYRAKKAGNWKSANELRKHYPKLPSKMINDPDFRRLWYVRYADDTLFGFIGTKAEAENIKRAFGDFLKTLKLDMSEEKTLITHALTERARFLNYEIHLMEENSEVRTRKDKVKARTINGGVWFSVPEDVIKQWIAKVSKHEKITYRAELLNVSDDDMIRTCEVQLQGLINYDSRAHNVVNRMRYLRHGWEESLAKTLAAKYKTKVTTIYRKYRQFFTIDKRHILGTEIQREGKKPLRAVFGRKPIQREPRSIIRDTIQTVYNKRNERLTRLLADVCELCGSKVNGEAHHIKKLADLKKRYKKEPPTWVKKLIAIRRKTLFVCEKCHRKIHNGTYDGRDLRMSDRRAKSIER
jgi:retron-type reverse transcriptase